MSNLYLIASTFAFSFLAYIWTQKAWGNAILKYIFILFTLYGAFLILNTYGFIIRR